MALYLVQHGLSLPKEEDPDRGLSEDGISDVKRIAEVARGYRVKVNTIVHSGKKRARQTAEIFHEALKPQVITQMSGMRPMDDVQEFSKGLTPESQTMFVGHLPFMERLTAWLITGDTKKPVFQFQNGGIVCLDRYQGSNIWVICWTLMPNIYS